jgi:hypothetical protein
MNEDPSLISAHPLIRRFVLNIIQNIREKKYSYEAREIVHADIVPKVSKKVMRHSMRERRIVPKPQKVEPRFVDNASKVNFRKRDMSELVAPIKAVPQRQNIAQVVPPVTPPVQVPMAPKNSGSGTTNSPPSGGKLILTQDYGKIMPLLNDPTISTIDCPGPDKPIFVVRAEQRELTKISLNILEIKALLEKLADDAHVPLVEGVFRVSVNGLNINAIISEMLGTKFVIRKATAYGLLE